MSRYLISTTPQNLLLIMSTKKSMDAIFAMTWSVPFPIFCLSCHMPDPLETHMIEMQRHVGNDRLRATNSLNACEVGH